MSSPFASEIIEDMMEIQEEGLSPEQYTNIYQVIENDCERLINSDLRCFVIGNYDEERGQHDRVIDVCDHLSNYRPYIEGFLLEDVDPKDEAWENWYIKFRVFLRRAMFVIGVFEDNDGGHELEVGEVDESDLYILEHDYYTDDGSEDTDLEHDRFDGMLAKLFEFLDRRGRLYR